jgi:hypothetical protein
MSLISHPNSNPNFILQIVNYRHSMFAHSNYHSYPQYTGTNTSCHRPLDLPLVAHLAQMNGVLNLNYVLI